ncbi:hypothetical protein GUITHDRAFT_103273 [Guillardia theta CCMP2712]|uniref:Uncharacterized protein n=1 Tax=Guillardia theta (strain CCMP2712) TaxID=905079 RepID=L1JR61_GUITC|nr:hypothetical protein GUITHDRAFT_103273 [Guillardia theta CCMP2712]EKX50680.1 hypothetical protein GUITHDRAFT_103273 [Guillardia theta CCMP2712]|eukprot:XP_005837660.1 hypothetical protein GUITHDRAFT_103273 [Guillardia theta CCMP2712]
MPDHAREHERTDRDPREVDSSDKPVDSSNDEFAHENLLAEFSSKFHLFRQVEENKNMEAYEHGLIIREDIQNILHKFRDRDRPCHICIFGLMGHGKSRFINLLLTGLSRQPVTSSASDDRDGEDYVRVVNEVPSGSGSTTRSYSKYALPLLATQGLGRSMFFVVDTIGVKFNDEFRPTKVVNEVLPCAGPNAVNVMKGEDVMQIRMEDDRWWNLSTLSDFLWSKTGLRLPGVPIALHQCLPVGQISSEPKATIVLRGGHVIRSVPISKLADPDGVNWTYTEDEGFKDRLATVSVYNDDDKSTGEDTTGGSCT